MSISCGAAVGLVGVHADACNMFVSLEEMPSVTVSVKSVAFRIPAPRMCTLFQRRVFEKKGYFLRGQRGTPGARAALFQESRFDVMVDVLRPRYERAAPEDEIGPAGDGLRSPPI